MTEINTLIFFFSTTMQSLVFVVQHQPSIVAIISEL